MDGEYQFNNADIINYINAVIFQFDKHYALLQCVYEALSHIKEKIYVNYILLCYQHLNDLSNFTI